jgi:hypothetical protein
MITWGEGKMGARVGRFGTGGQGLAERFAIIVKLIFDCEAGRISDFRFDISELVVFDVNCEIQRGPLTLSLSPDYRGEGNMRCAVRD